MRTILTFDIGTTSVKTCLFDENLNRLGSANEEYVLLTDSGNRVELEAEVYWRAVVHGACRVAETSGLGGLRSVCAICVTTQGETLIPVNQKGNALRNAIVWLDARAEAEGRFLSALPSASGHYARTGVAAIDGMTPLSKVLWVKKHEPQVYAATHKFLLLEDYIIHRLCGAFVSEKVLMSTTGYYDIREDAYLTDLLQEAGLDPGRFPEVLDSGTVVGTVSSEAIEAMGLPQDAVVVTGAMDQVAASIGSGSISEGVVTETTGTTLILMTASDARCFDNPQHINVYRHVRKGMFYIIPFCITAGIVLKWFKDEFCQEQVREAERTGRNVYDLLGDLAASCAAGADGLIAIPYFNGILQPDAQPGYRGVFLGASLNTGKAHFVRAIFEGVGCMLRENLELLDGMGIVCHELRSFGGGSRSAIWQQIKADICGLRIGTMHETECASLGAAAIAAVAMGWKRDLEEATQSNGMKDVYIPDSDRAEDYNALYQRYLRTIERTRGLF